MYPFLQYDFMAGFNTQEASLITSYLEKLAKIFGYKIEDGGNIGMVNVFLQEYLSSYFPNTYASVVFRFKEMFFDGIELGKKASPAVAQTVMNMFTDLLFGAPTLALLDGHAERSNHSTYMYTFNYILEESQREEPSWLVPIIFLLM